VSDMVARRLRRYHLPPDRVVTVYNGVLAEDVNNRENADDTANEKDGVELRRAQRRAYGIPDDAFVVTIVARLAPDKKIHTFLDAMSRVIAERPEAWALVVGEASAADLGYRRTIQAMTAGQPLEQRTTWMAFEENIQKVFSVTDIVALCATNEPFPRSVLEGLASGVPAIVPDTGGSTELVEHGQSGLFFRSDSPEDLAAAVLRVIGDGDLRTKLARQSRDRARRFDVRHHVRAVQAVYDELAGTVYTS
jgi:glycosyltransferase involved in cell wall biosynthesis